MSEPKTNLMFSAKWKFAEDGYKIHEYDKGQIWPLADLPVSRADQALADKVAKPTDKEPTHISTPKGPMEKAMAAATAWIGTPYVLGAALRGLHRSPQGAQVLRMGLIFSEDRSETRIFPRIAQIKQVVLSYQRRRIGRVHLDQQEVGILVDQFVPLVQPVSKAVTQRIIVWKRGFQSERCTRCDDMTGLSGQLNRAVTAIVESSDSPVASQPRA